VIEVEDVAVTAMTAVFPAGLKTVVLAMVVSLN
jgi:hypothetical protein